jgi:DNA-directed RNA polymerase specialized sigma subunit
VTLPPDYQEDFPHFDLSVLTEREHLVIHLHYGAGWSLRRIARSLGVQPYAVRCSHNAALSKLSRSLGLLTDAHSNGKDHE